MTPFAEVVLAAGGCFAASLLAVRQIIVDSLRSEERTRKADEAAMERERQRDEEERRLADPTFVKSKRAAISERRRILQKQREEEVARRAYWQKVWAEEDHQSGYALDNLNSSDKAIRNIDRYLFDLADEEVKLPTYDGTE